MADSVQSQHPMSLPEDSWIERAVTFNLAPVEYVHQSWIETFANADLIGTLETEPHAAPLISQYLLDAFDLTEKFYDDFSEPRSRLALLDGALLESLFLYTGLALRSQELRSEIDGARIARLREALGPQAMEFAVKRVPFLGALPDFTYEPSAPDPRDRLTLIGAVYALCPRAWADPAYSGRVVLKLPHGFSRDLLAPWPEQSANDPRTDDGSALPPLIRRLIKEFIPEWQPLFA